MWPRSLIVHADGTIAGCTEDDERDGCFGRDERHDGCTERCINWYRDRCDYCGAWLHDEGHDPRPWGARRFRPPNTATATAIATAASIDRTSSGAPTGPRMMTNAPTMIAEANDATRNRLRR